MLVIEFIEFVEWIEEEVCEWVCLVVEVVVVE